MIAKKYLRRIRFLDVKYEHAINEIAKFREQARMCSLAMGERVQSSNNRTMEDIIVKLMEEEYKANQAIDELINLKEDARKLIFTLENPIEINILIKRYFQFMRFKDIAIAVHMSERHTIRAHNNGLKELNKILKNKSCQ